MKGLKHEVLVAFTFPTIGILGGMGPEATVELYLRLIRKFQNRGAKYDLDFPPVLINSLPVPDVVDSLEDEPLLINSLNIGLKKLEDYGCDFVVIACVSMYKYRDLLQKEVKIPILDILNCIKKNESSFGIISTRLTATMFPHSITLNEEQQKIVTMVIMNILSGDKLEKDKSDLIDIMIELKKRGAEQIFLGCTELPLLISQDDFEVIDCIELMVNCIMEKVDGGKENDKKIYL